MQNFDNLLGSLADLSLDEKLVLRDALDDQLQLDADASSVEVPADVWVAQFTRWAEEHRTLPHEADDSRESIYEGRGE